ncbi:MAG: C-GCAxxG-C-C family (seleno)protein [Candidatus Scalinduaceae bacterium]
MKEKDAVRYFCGKEQYNCAQAILKAHQDDLNIKDEQINEYKQFGGGKAEGGLCGAIFVIKNLLDDKEKSDHIEHSFNLTAGATTCREIRKLKKLSCPGCVKTASQLLSKHINEAK